MIILNLFEVMGTIAFAISGTLVGMQKRLDLFGVVFLSIITAVGGGIFRDLLIGNTPPAAFRKPIYCIISMAVAFIICFINRKFHKLKNVILIFDAIGLGVFTAIGSNTALFNNMKNPFLVVCMGLFTGIGGGILRDVFVQDTPLVFKKEIYAVASIMGALVLYYSSFYVSNITSLYLCFFTTFVFRLLAIKYDLNLPKAHLKKY